jgi:hypothetical protein
VCLLKTQSAKSVREKCADQVRILAEWPGS